MAEPPQVQEIVKERYTYLDELLGSERSAGERASLRQVFQLLNLARDAEGSRALVGGWTHVQLVGGAGVNNVISAAAPAGFLRVMHGCSIQHNDAGTPREAWIGLWDGTFTVVLESFRGAMSSLDRLGLGRTVILQSGDALVGAMSGIAGASTMRILTAYVDIPNGDYIVGLT